MISTYTFSGRYANKPMNKVLEVLPGDSQRPSVEKLQTFAPRPSRAELIARGEAMRK